VKKQSQFARGGNDSNFSNNKQLRRKMAVCQSMKTKPIKVNLPGRQNLPKQSPKPSALRLPPKVRLKKQSQFVSA
jgi:hypothetical protein